MPRSADEVMYLTEQVGRAWFPSVVQIDELLAELYSLNKAGHVVGDIIDDLLDYRLTRSLEEKFQQKAGR